MSFALHGERGITQFNVSITWIHLDIHIGFIMANLDVASKII